MDCDFNARPYFKEHHTIAVTEVQYKDHNVDFISHKNINPRAHLNQDRLHPNGKG